MNNKLTTKRMSMKKYALIALAGLTLAACKKQGGEIPTVNPEEGKDASLSLSITSAANIGTYASTVGSDDGTDNEKKVNTVDVFLYSEEGSLTPAGYERFSGTDANLSTPKKIKTKTGRKRIYIGINLPQSLVNMLKAGYSAMENPYDVNMAQLATPNDGLMMFSQSVTSLDIKEGDDPDNKVTIPVARLLAKAGVLQGSNLSLTDIQGGTVSNLQYTLAQCNKKIVVGQLYDFKDANWAYINPFVSGIDGALTAEYQANFTAVLNTDYKAVDASNTENKNLKTVYMPENTAENPAPTQVTYIQVRAKFTPTKLEDGATPNADGTFYVMFGQIGTNDALHQLYFADKTKAEAEAAKTDYNNGTVQRSVVLTYNQGYCYFRLYLNEDKVAGATKLGILRNTFFKAQITKINGLGTPLEGQIPGTPGTPGNPGGNVKPPKPVDPTQPVNPGNLDANIQATITITPWTLITSEHEI
ncbi:Mfa1 family fimbria major subunit [Sphingobacterium spiritivorum]|nr:Mfa1 family fimbria major subunit [Sphingobacterium spiritivorum]QQS97087.1 Mfa1 family fimbria major subunit [Sphingobacterium spiritivorum]